MEIYGYQVPSKSNGDIFPVTCAHVDSVLALLLGIQCYCHLIECNEVERNFKQWETKNSRLTLSGWSTVSPRSSLM